MDICRAMGASSSPSLNIGSSSTGLDQKQNMKYIHPAADLDAAGPYTTRLKVVGKGKGKEKSVVLREDYTHLIGHCSSHPSSLPLLSYLPNDLLSLILCFLPLKEAVRTCIISKRWRNLWSFMPNLSLHGTQSVKFITNALNLISLSRLDKLDFDILKVTDKFPTNQVIDSWLSSACSRHIENLVLRLTMFDSVGIQRNRHIPRIEHWLTQPSPSFSFLKRLTLRYCMISPSVCKQLTSLEYLALEKLVLDQNMLQEVTSSCPMLVELKLVDCNRGIPFLVSLKNPKTYKLCIEDNTTSLRWYYIRPHELVIHAPFLTTLIVATGIERLYELDVPALGVLKLSNFGKRQYYDYASYCGISWYQDEKIALIKILDGLDSKELDVCSMVLGFLSLKCVREERFLVPPMIKVKHLRLQTQQIPQELPGLIYLLKSCIGVETLVLDLKNIDHTTGEINIRSENLRYLKSSTTVLKETNQLVLTKNKKKRECLDDEHGYWSSLKHVLSTQMPDLKNIIINEIKRVHHYIVRKKEGRISCDSGARISDYAVDENEFMLVKLLLTCCVGLENITVRTKDVNLIQELDGMGMMKVIDPLKCKSVSIDDEVDQMMISQWDKVILSLSKGSPRAKINVSNV